MQPTDARRSGASLPLRDAALIVRELWRPMAAWSLLVWASGLLVLSPLTAFALGRLLGSDGVISNEEVVAWLLTPAGLGFVLLWLASALTLSVAQFGGMFRLVQDQRARGGSLARAFVALTTGLPVVFRFCLTVVAGALLLLAPLVAWIGVLYVTFLREHDINYYLSARPRELTYALSLAAPVAIAWALGAIWLLARTLPALPAFFDGHRPARAAFRAGWASSKGRWKTLAARLVAAGVTVALVRAVVAGMAFMLASAIVDRIAGASGSLRPVLVATALFTVCSGAFDIALTFFGFAWHSTLLSRFYLEGASDPGPAARAEEGRAFETWLTPRRIAVMGGVAIAINAASTLTTLEGVSEPPEFLVIAHRAGAHNAPENTLLALGRAIEARANFAEIDVQRTRDGIVVVNHDADLMRVARDPRTIAGTEYAAFAGVRQGTDDGSPPEERRLARFDEFLERAKGRIDLAVELKYYGWDPLLAPQVLSEIRSRGLEQQVMIISLSLQAIEQVRSLAPDIATGYLSSVSVGALDKLPVVALALSRQRSTAPVIRAAHAGGREVYVWTVNDAGGMIEMIGRGADGIITDDPGLAGRVRDELRSLTSTEFLLLRFSDALTDEESRDEIPTVQ